VLAAARGFLSGRRSGQTPSPLIPVPPSTVSLVSLFKRVLHNSQSIIGTV
jgi:hypothetical protein